MKARAGSDFIFRWSAPFAVADTSAPVLTLRHPTLGNITPAFTAVATQASVSDVAADRRTLTINAAPAPSAGLQGDEAGHAHLVTAAHGVIPVRVLALPDSSTAVLAEPLSMDVTVRSGDALRWSIYEATLDGAAELATALSRPLPWTVAWEADFGSGLPTRPRRHEGLLAVVRQPFSTGLHDAILFDLVPGLATQLPRRQQSWAPQMARAEAVLIRWLRRDLRELGKTEDDVNGDAFLDVHALLTAYVITQGSTAVGADNAPVRDHFYEAARQFYDDVMTAIPWLDDGDGEVEAGETNINPGPGSRIGRSSFTSAPTRTFTRTMDM